MHRDEAADRVGHVRVLGGIWLSFVVGAVVGAAAYDRWEFLSLAAPLLVLVLVTVRIRQLI
jgi:uncharacterized membrane protein YoaK (UPF0700 family)